MRNYRNNLFGLSIAATLAVAAAVWLCASAASAQGTPGHEAEAAHSHAAGEPEHNSEEVSGVAAAHGPPGFQDDLPLWGIVAFVGFILAIRKLGWGSFTSGLAGREAEERQLISEAEELHRTAAEHLRVQRGQMEALDETVRAALTAGGQNAEQTRREIRAAADRDAASAKTRAEQEIGRVKDQTLGELFENFTQRIVDATQERLKGRLDSAAQDKLIDAALTDFAAGQQKSA